MIMNDDDDRGGGERSRVPHHHRPLKILLLDSAGAEQVPVGKVLRGHVSDGQLGEHHLGAGLADLVQFVVEDVPLGIHDRLVVLEVRSKLISP